MWMTLLSVESCCLKEMAAVIIISLFLCRFFPNFAMLMKLISLFFYYVDKHLSAAPETIWN